MTLRVVLADDHPLLLDGLVGTIEAAPDMTVVGSARDAAGAERLAAAERPDIVLLDIAMPGSGLAAARRIRAASPEVAIVMLTSSEDEADVRAALDAGAAGYVLKGMSGRELLDVLRKVAAGEVFVPPAIAGRMLRRAPRPAPVVDPLADLSARERDVLALVVAGRSNAEIGGRLGLTEKTVKHYVSAILRKLDVSSRTEAALLAYKAGLRPED